MEIFHMTLLCFAIVITYSGIFVPIGAEDGTSEAPSAGGGGSSVSEAPGGTPGGTVAPTPSPCPANCKKINRFTCGEWIERGSNDTIWNWNGRYCAATWERREWMRAQNCVPFDSQKERIFPSEDDCKNTCNVCIKF